MRIVDKFANSIVVFVRFRSVPIREARREKKGGKLTDRHHDDDDDDDVMIEHGRWNERARCRISMMRRRWAENDRGYSIFHSSGSARLIDSYSADTPGASSDNSVTTSTELGKVSEPDAKSFATTLSTVGQRRYRSRFVRFNGTPKRRSTVHRTSPFSPSLSPELRLFHPQPPPFSIRGRFATN